MQDKQEFVGADTLHKVGAMLTSEEFQLVHELFAEERATLLNRMLSDKTPDDESLKIKYALRVIDRDFAPELLVERLRKKLQKALPTVNTNH